MSRPVWVATLAWCGVVAGCGDDPGRPPTVRYGEETCSHCRMIISDDRFASALVTSQGETRKFDDVGCLVDGEAGRPSPPGSTYWVRDFAGGKWIDARTASYVRSAPVPSPMGYGLKALGGTPPSAPGPALKFHELPAVVAAQRRGSAASPTPDR